MMELMIGIIIGILLCIFSSLIMIIKRTAVERIIDHIEQKAQAPAEIFEIPSMADEAIENVIRENEQRGRDTDIKEL